MTEFFITGTYRSGTTLLDKLLHNHPQAAALSQPAPALFLEAKKAFLESRHLPIPSQVLNDYFRNSAYRPEDITQFLLGFKYTEEQLKEVNNQKRKFITQNPVYTSTPELKASENNDFASVFRQLIHSALENKKAVGSKEVICEEFLPYLLRQHIKCILVLRDPRDVLASTYFGKGQEFSGSPRPFLWMVRNWRKSVAFALELLGNENLLVLRYEGLVQNPSEYLLRLSHFLGLDPFPENFLAQPLQQQNGNTWQSNSSHAATSVISPGSTGTYQKYLPEDLQHFVETVCFPEMKVLGYIPEITAPDYSLIKDFKEPFQITRPGIDPYFSEKAEEKQAEILRLELLKQDDISAQEIQQYFIFEKAYRVLKNLRTVSFNK